MKSRSLGGLRLRRRWIQGSVRRARRISFSNDRSKHPGYDFQLFWYGRRSQRRSIRIHASRYVRSSQIAEITGEGMPTGMDTTATQSETEYLGTQSKNQLFHLSETFSVTLWQDCFGKEDWKSTFETKVRKNVPTWEFFSHPLNITTKKKKHMWTTSRSRIVPDESAPLK